jgi:hypothetical protein
VRPIPVVAFVALAGIILGGPLTPAAKAASSTWSAPRRVAASALLTSLHELAAGPSALHLVTARTGPRERDDAVTYRRSVDGGATWSSSRTVSASGRTWRYLMPNLAVAAGGDLVAAAWRMRSRRQTALFVGVSRDGGRTWRSPLQVAGSRPGRGLGVPSVTIATGAILVAWTDRASGEVRVRRSTDAGATFGHPTRIATTGLSISCSRRVIDGLAGLASAGRIAYVAWSEARRGQCIADRIRLRASSNGGATWGRAVTVTGRDSYGWPELAARGDRVLVSAQRPDGSLAVARSRDRARTFQDVLMAPPPGRYVGAADVALASGGRAWLAVPEVAYVGRRVAWSRVRFRESRDGGATWTGGLTIVARARLLRQAPNLAGWSGRPVVVYGSGPPDGGDGSIWVTRRR